MSPTWTMPSSMVQGIEARGFSTASVLPATFIQNSHFLGFSDLNAPPPRGGSNE